MSVGSGTKHLDLRGGGWRHGTTKVISGVARTLVVKRGLFESIPEKKVVVAAVVAVAAVAVTVVVAVAVVRVYPFLAQANLCTLDATYVHMSCCWGQLHVSAYSFAKGSAS